MGPYCCVDFGFASVLFCVRVCVVFFLIDVSFCVEVRDQSNEKYLIAYGRLTVHNHKK